jgi:hypothetical protein
MTLFNVVAIQRYGTPTVVRRVRAMGPLPSDAFWRACRVRQRLAPLPASFNAASNACGHRAHLISAISVADISGDNARWAGWRAIALRSLLGQSPSLLRRCRAGSHHRLNGDGGADRSRWARPWAGEGIPATGVSPIRGAEADRLRRARPWAGEGNPAQECRRSGSRRPTGRDGRGHGPAKAIRRQECRRSGSRRQTECVPRF